MLYFFQTDNDMKGEVNVAYIPDTGDLEKTGAGPVYIKNGKTDIVSTFSLLYGNVSLFSTFLIL